MAGDCVLSRIDTTPHRWAARLTAKGNYRLAAEILIQAERRERQARLSTICLIPALQSASVTD